MVPDQPQKYTYLTSVGPRVLKVHSVLLFHRRLTGSVDCMTDADGEIDWTKNNCRMRAGPQFSLFRLTRRWPPTRLDASISYALQMLKPIPNSS